MPELLANPYTLLALGAVFGWTLRGIVRTITLRPREFALPLHVHVHDDLGNNERTFTLERGDHVRIGVSTQEPTP